MLKIKGIANISQNYQRKMLHMDIATELKTKKGNTRIAWILIYIT